jgi:hypothetical protein
MSRRPPVENPKLGVGEVYTFGRTTQGTRLVFDPMYNILSAVMYNGLCRLWNGSVPVA